MVSSPSEPCYVILPEQKTPEKGGDGQVDLRTRSIKHVPNSLFLSLQPQARCLSQTGGILAETEPAAAPGPRLALDRILLTLKPARKLPSVTPPFPPPPLRVPSSICSSRSSPQGPTGHPALRRNPSGELMARGMPSAAAPRNMEEMAGSAIPWGQHLSSALHRSPHFSQTGG